MASNRERIAAAQKAAEISGKSLRATIDDLAPTWNLAPHDLALLHVQAAQQPAARSAAQPLVNQIAQRDAAKLAVQRKREGDAAAILAFENYQRLKASNPVAAAASMNANAFEINRGRELATEPPEGPEAA